MRKLSAPDIWIVGMILAGCGRDVWQVVLGILLLITWGIFLLKYGWN